MCSLFGLIDYENAVPSFARKVIVKILAQECEARGTDATGIAYNTHGSLRVYKRPVRAAKFKFNLPSDSHVIMGHTRMTTKGNQKVNNNNHPFYGSVSDNVFALAHNGVLYNDEQLRSQMQLPHTTIETDSYVAVQILEQIGHISFEALKEMSETVSGSFCFSVLTDENDVYISFNDLICCTYSNFFFGCFSARASFSSRAISFSILSRCSSETICSSRVLPSCISIPPT